jgi:hypothetical protein
MVRASMGPKRLLAVVFAMGLPCCGGKVLEHVGGDAGPTHARRSEDADVHVPASSTPTSAPLEPHGAPASGSFGACPDPTITLTKDGLVHGTIEGWFESNGRIGFSATGVTFPGGGATDGVADWSVAMLSADDSAGSAYFFSTTSSDGSQTLVASAPSVSDVSQITIGVRLPYAADATPPVLVGEFVVFRASQSGVAMALRVDGVAGTRMVPNGCKALAVGKFTFYVQPDGSTDFSAFKGL